MRVRTRECEMVTSNCRRLADRKASLHSLPLKISAYICCSLFRSFGVRQTGQMVMAILRLASQE